MKIRDYVILTQIALLILKLINVVTWSWFWVLALFMAYAIFAIVTTVVGVILVIRKARKDLEQKVKQPSEWQQRVQEIRNRKSYQAE